MWLRETVAVQMFGGGLDTRAPVAPLATMRVERTSGSRNRIASCHEQHASGRWIVYRSELGGGAALFAYVF